MSENDAEYKAKLYDAYVDERQKLDSKALEVASRYDRTILTLSGGTLALSVTFLERIIPAPVAWTVIILIAGWLFLLACVLLQLFALAHSRRSIGKQIEWLDEDHSKYFAAMDVAVAVRETHLKPRPENPYVVKTNRLNRAAESLLVLGLLCIFAFSATNMYLRKENTNARREQPDATALQAAATGPGASTGKTPATSAGTGQIGGAASSGNR